MADLSDVETALVSALTDLFYPQGGQQNCAVGGGPRLYRGLPMTAALSSDLLQGIVNVNVMSVPNTGRNTTRWSGYGWTNPVSPGLTASVSDNSVSFAGSPNPGDLAGVLIEEMASVYQVQNGDTALVVATALAGLVRRGRLCVLQDAVLTVPGVTTIVARTSALQTTTTEIGRQEHVFRVGIWAPGPAARDVVCSAILSSLAQVAFLPLVDGSSGRLRYKNTSSSDDGQDTGLYSRDLDYEVEFPTTVIQQLPTMLFGDLVCNGATSFD